MDKYAIVELKFNLQIFNWKNYLKDVIQYHGQSYVVSDDKIDFSINQTFTGSTRDLKKAKAHGNFRINKIFN